MQVWDMVASILEKSLCWLDKSKSWFPISIWNAGKLRSPMSATKSIIRRDLNPGKSEAAFHFDKFRVNIVNAKESRKDPIPK